MSPLKAFRYPHRFLVLALSACACLAAGASHSQSADAPATADIPGETTTRTDKSLIPFPILFYQPETGTGFGASVVYMFSLGADAPDAATANDPSFRSSVGLTAIYTTKKQITTGIGAELYPGGGRYRVLANLGY